MPPLCVAVERRVFGMARLIDADALLAEYDRQHEGEPGKARKLIEDAPNVSAVPVSELLSLRDNLY